MRISEAHAILSEDNSKQGPLTDSRTGHRNRQNRGVAHFWRVHKRAEASQRQRKVEPERTKRYRLNRKNRHHI